MKKYSMVCVFICCLFLTACTNIASDYHVEAAGSAHHGNTVKLPEKMAAFEEDEESYDTPAVSDEEANASPENSNAGLESEVLSDTLSDEYGYLTIQKETAGLTEIIDLAGDYIENAEENTQRVSEENIRIRLSDDERWVALRDAIVLWNDGVSQVDISPEAVFDLPYIGMPAEYLDYTSLGPAYYNGANHEWIKGEWKTRDIYFYVDQNYAVIYTVWLVDDVVYEVRDRRADPWYFPAFSGNAEIYGPLKKGETADKRKYSKESKTETTTASAQRRYDPYDVYDFDDPDEFADEWAEEFGDGDEEEGWDDAWDYWQEHHS